MKRIIKSLILTLALIAAPMHAAVNTVDAVPAATLMVPYFEVDLANDNGMNTIFTVSNSRSNPALAHVTLWTDRGVASYSFDVYLGGYDVVEVDMRLLFNGLIPQTSPTTTPPGPNSGAPVSFPACAGLLAQGRIPAATVTAIRNAHTGLASTLYGGNCGGKAYGDNKARGYVTIDSTSACTTLNPTSPGYFVNGGTGIANNDNILWGDYVIQDRTNLFAYADNLVHIEASASDAATNGAGDYTFYGNRVAASGADNREGLPIGWMHRYDNGGAFTTHLYIWRDPGSATSFACGAPPALKPLDEIVAWDKAENVAGVSKTNVAGLAAQDVDVASLGIPFSTGFVSWNFNDAANPGLFSGKAQAWLSPIHKGTGRAGQLTGWATTPVTGTNFFFGAGSSSPACSDGVDNDSDGKIDFPADTSCRSANQFYENGQCSDGIDNDGDGLNDLADPECYGPTDLREDSNPQCDDQVDNDLDGLIDYPNDPRCSNMAFSPFAGGVNSEAEGICGDGIDNDGDGKIDFPADTECASRTQNTENPQCADGIDNDSDGKIDLADAGCTGSKFNNLEGTSCDDGIDNDGDGKIDFPADPSCKDAGPTSNENRQCSDGLDNDGDGKIDLLDSGCSDPTDNSENTPQCSDGFDNDGDGQIDMNDNGCSVGGDDFEGPDCSDTVDNDLDGLVDAADPGCASPTDNNEFAGRTTRECSDGVDNDGDGLIDSGTDPGCSTKYDDNEFN